MPRNCLLGPTSGCYALHPIWSSARSALSWMCGRARLSSDVQARFPYSARAPDAKMSAELHNQMPGDPRVRGLPAGSARNRPTNPLPFR